MMPSLTCFRFRFTPNWLMIILTVVFFSLFVKLGFWQIQRAEEKEAMLSMKESFALKEPLQWNETMKLPQHYEHIKVYGTYLPQLFLLDNQHHQHQFGYDVLSPLLLSNGRVVLIDRGFIAADVTRVTVPQIKIPEGRIEINGSTYHPEKNPWTLGDKFEQKTQNTTIIEVFDAKILNQLLQKKVYPFIIRLDKDNPNGFVREWATVSMPPQRHLAYALQWFVMAFVVLILFVVLNLKKKNEKNKE